MEIQLWQIDGSAPAPRLSVVEQPNDWVKAAKQTSGGEEGIGAQLKYAYWTAFNDYAFQDDHFSKLFRRRKASSDHWYALSIGLSGVHISLLVNTRTDVIAVELSINDNKALYDRFAEHRTEIEAAVGQTLDWRRLNHRKASRILLERKQAGIRDRDAWNSQFDWFMEYAARFRKAFGAYL